jgi:peroxiredoxin
MPFELISDTNKHLCEAFGVMREKKPFWQEVYGN